MSRKAAALSAVQVYEYHMRECERCLREGRFSVFTETEHLEKYRDALERAAAARGVAQGACNALAEQSGHRSTFWARRYEYAQGVESALTNMPEGERGAPSDEWAMAYTRAVDAVNTILPALVDELK